MRLASGWATKRWFRRGGARWFGMEAQEKMGERRDRRELVAYLRKLARWKNNDVVKLAFLEPEDVELVDRLDLTGVVELRRNANGTFEAKFVDKVRVLAMLRELMEERRDGELERFLDGLFGPGDGDEG